MDEHNPSTRDASYGEYLAAIRKARGFPTTEAFARAIYGDAEKPSKTSQQANVWNWESDKSRPRGTMLGKIATVLKVSPASINPKRFKPAMMKRMLLTMPREDEVSEEVLTSVIEGAGQGLDLFTEDVGVDPALLPKTGEAYSAYVTRLREARGFESKAELQKAANISSSVVLSGLERGASVPAEENIYKLAAALDVPVSLLDPKRFQRLQEQGEEALETYGEYLGRLRKAAGYNTQVDLGRAYHEKFSTGNEPQVPGQLISKWESGRVVPNAASISKLASLLGVSAKTLDPKRFIPGRLLPPTLKVVEPPKPPAPEPAPEVERIQNDAGMNVGDEETMHDVQWDQHSAPPASVPSVRQEYGQMPQFLKQHVDIFGVSKTDDPAYVRIRFDAIVPRKTAGALMRELVILTTEDLLGDSSE